MNDFVCIYGYVCVCVCVCVCIHTFQSQRKAMPRNAQTTAQLHSSHMLVKSCTKFSKPGLQQYVNRELPDVQAGFRKGRGTRDQIANIRWIMEKGRVPEKHVFLLY